MTTPSDDFEIFLVATPGLEATLCAEARARGFRGAAVVKGGVVIQGGWPDVWRANLELRGASRILARFAAFRALHLAQLDKRARKVEWAKLLRPDVPVRVEAASKGSRIYHAGAVVQRIERAIREELGATVGGEDGIGIKARIEDDLCTLSVDTSGAPLHKRGHKQEVNTAPMRETLAASFLRQCGYDGRQPLVDPMCGSGTFVIEAAEIAAGLAPGRSRRFAFEHLASFDPEAWRQVRAAAMAHRSEPVVRVYGSDRDAGAIVMSRANAERAGVAGFTRFERRAVADLTAPEGPPGLVIVNPPYGTRIGERKTLIPLYRSLGERLRGFFPGWRVGLITSDAGLAAATDLPLAPFGSPVSHGGLTVTLFVTSPLP